MGLVGKLDFHSEEYTGHSSYDTGMSVRGYHPPRPLLNDSRDEVSSWLLENSLENEETLYGKTYTLFDEGVLSKVTVNSLLLTNPEHEDNAPFKYTRNVHIEFSPEVIGIPSSLKNILNNFGYRLKDDSEPIPSP